MSTGYLCLKKDKTPVEQDDVRAILQPFIVETLPMDLDPVMMIHVRLKTGEPLSFWVKPAYVSLEKPSRLGRTRGINAVLRALADAGFLIHSEDDDDYIDPHSDEGVEVEE